MSSINGLSGIFPKEGSIPYEFSIAAPIVQRRYLCNGEIHSWDGPMQEVLSPLYPR